MNDAIRHYDQLLAEHYSWMVGVPFEQKAAEQKALLSELGIGQGPHGLAIDLGPGPGYQSAALADLGFSRVIAIDASQRLLDELSQNKASRPIEPVRDDIRRLSRHAKPGSVEAIVCMGDTLTHLESLDDVSRLLADAHRLLMSKGRLVLTFRDLFQELSGLDRFIPVQSGADRVMVCFLEYEPERVKIHDLIHVRKDGGWEMHKSSYRKLRVAPAKVADELKGLGFQVTYNGPRAGMWAISAVKP